MIRVAALPGADFGGLTDVAGEDDEYREADGAKVNMIASTKRSALAKHVVSGFSEYLRLSAFRPPRRSPYPNYVLLCTQITTPRSPASNSVAGAFRSMVLKRIRWPWKLIASSTSPPVWGWRKRPSVVRLSG